MNELKSYLKRPLSLLLRVAVTAAAILTIAVLIFLILYILINGIPYMKPSLFALEYNSENVSVVPSIITTLYLVGLSLLIAVPFGMGCAIYLTEYAKPTSKFVRVIRVTTETLSGIPSIIYGLFGMIFFVTALHFGYSILAGALTAAIMILPLIIRTTEEAIKSVPDLYREASYGLGAGKLRTIFRVVLPSAMPGILSGIILAIGRVVGETAALLYTSGTVAKIPDGLFSGGRTLALHMYVLSGEGLHMGEAFATGIILLVLVVLINFATSRIVRRFTAKGLQ